MNRFCHVRHADDQGKTSIALRDKFPGKRPHPSSIPTRTNENCARIVRGEYEHPFIAQHSTTFTKAPQSFLVGNNVVQPVEGKYDRIKRSILKGGKIRSVRQHEI